MATKSEKSISNLEKMYDLDDNHSESGGDALGLVMFWKGSFRLSVWLSVVCWVLQLANRWGGTNQNST